MNNLKNQKLKLLNLDKLLNRERQLKEEIKNLIINQIKLEFKENKNYKI